MGLQSTKNIPPSNESQSEQKEKEKISRQIEDYYKRFINTTTQTFDLQLFQHDLIPNVNSFNLLNYLNSFYKLKKVNNGMTLSQKNFKKEDLVTLCCLLTKNSENEIEMNENLILYRKNTFLVLYNIFAGLISSSNNYLDLNIIIEVFDFIVSIYINNHKSKFSKEITFNYDKKYLTNFLIENLSPLQGSVSYESIVDFVDNKLYNLDSFLKNYFRTKFLEKNNEFNFHISLPIVTEAPSALTIDKFLLFSLSNAHIYSKPFAFKLFNCSKNGYNIPSLIYSFIGFPGPVAIFIQHFDKNTNTDHVLGLFLHSNFKECYEKFCGDELSFIFTISPKMFFYKVIGDSSKIVFISSKNQKYGKTNPGIGLGCTLSSNKFRFWIDSNECFTKSYFNKYDDVFEDGSPFDNTENMLNISNIDVYGFGNEDDFKDLMKKQEKDKITIEKMKKVDRAAFAQSEFDKEMFFENNFSHEKEKK